MPRPATGVIRDFWLTTRTIATGMERDAERVARQELGIGLTQYLVLAVADARPGQLSQQAIARDLGLTKGTVSRLVELLEQTGLATRHTSPVSRRERLVWPTARGRDLVRRADRLLEDEQARAFGALDAGEVQTMLRLLHQLADHWAPR